MILYKTVLEYGEAEIVIQKSRFIARVMPVDNYEDGQAFVAQMKQEYKDATHNVPAIVCGPKQEYQWASDDGEPSGTSGLPMLKLITDLELTNLAVVVTRYFGGVKLGTGGLSRAYTSIAKAGLEAAGICGMAESVIFECELDYTHLPKIQNSAKDGLFTIGEITYADKVNLELSSLVENADETRSRLRNLTLGQVVIKNEKKELKKIEF